MNFKLLVFKAFPRYPMNFSRCISSAHHDEGFHAKKGALISYSVSDILTGQESYCSLLGGRGGSSRRRGRGPNSLEEKNIYIFKGKIIVTMFF